MFWFLGFVIDPVLNSKFRFWDQILGSEIWVLRSAIDRFEVRVLGSGFSDL